jgi:hypothetical protein
MLIAAIAVMCVAVLIGLKLSAQYLIEEAPSAHAVRLAYIHGAAGALCIALFYLALHRPGPPASKFGWSALYVLVAALAGGLTILTLQLSRKPVSTVLVAMHATVGMAGAVMLAAYFSTPGSFGR